MRGVDDEQEGIVTNDLIQQELDSLERLSSMIRLARTSDDKPLWDWVCELLGKERELSDLREQVEACWRPKAMNRRGD